MTQLLGCLGALFLTLFAIVLLPVLRLSHFLFGMNKQAGRFTGENTREEQHTHQQESQQKEQKIYQRDEGEYVDFEEMK
ncbi:DUF4834 family protein [Alloprevotella rava]|uniref:DUF4834 domain-containing protein n=2 Tax=Alloprevotella rava TaxID=671218 RepID=G5GBP7_9BACT|nr:DUF4834 family protein [Alloprevotella rava]EHG23032.1 hypothetical protein HMPREF9332_00998 [Alloprevotella rava F0323]MBB3701912.1 hypothetical protein [Alloprevotella rava]